MPPLCVLHATLAGTFHRFGNMMVHLAGLGHGLP
jgi:hypothetical protein